ncbi:hypothetical protein F2Q69_00036908 [Brassica cretica]|uniref:Uncharacterized protein n=3 Tax=Brassica TaxID=3705 RepID=A0A0D3AAN8_BRAOL|nr:hypothetical protein F2Q69_00036908 [Brassica cretica]VDD51394.1 unnamed protein product [Brassica oleracea]
MVSLLPQILKPASATQPSTLSGLVVLFSSLLVTSSVSGIPTTSRKTVSLWELGFAFLTKRDQLSVDDVKVYIAVVEKPSDAFPSASKCFPGKAVGVSIGCSAAPAQAEAPAADDDDDMDHFGDETEEEKKAAEEREATKKDTKKPKEKKLVPVGYGVKKLTIMLT